MSPELTFSNGWMHSVLRCVSASSLALFRTAELSASPRLPSRSCTPRVPESPIPTMTTLGRGT
eukprot:6587314-Prymnesium_polylepis.2